MQRVDIQALRGFAVIIVVFFHAKLPLFAGGFLGVDVFFVISGYLITRLIAGGIRDGSFSISSFYHRRAQRLLPAAYVTFLVSAIAAPFLLNDPELHDFRGQLLGALAFCANIVLWRQSGYFDGEADLKPLLHTWSLSVEEQYYFLLPVILTFTPRRHWFRLLLGVTSLGFAAFAYRQGNSSTFYLLPTRAWELGIGSLGALLATNELSHRVLRLAFWPACVALTLAPFIPTSSYVSLITVATCTATLIIILREYPILDSNVFMSGLAWLGEPPRDYRRLRIVRTWSHGEIPNTSI